MSEYSGLLSMLMTVWCWKRGIRSPVKMKIIVFLAVLGFVSAIPSYGVDTSVEVRGLIEDGINKTINDLLKDIPQIINVDAVDVNFDDLDLTFASGRLNASSISIQGVKDLVATYIKLNILSLSVDIKLNISELLLNLKYWADLLLLDLVPLYGDGRINIVIDEIDIQITGTASLTGGIQLKDIAIILGLGDANFDLKGLINNPEFSALVSTALDDNFVTFINKNQKVITGIISPLLEGVINSILKPNNTMTEDKTFAQYRTY